MSSTTPAPVTNDAIAKLVAALAPAVAPQVAQLLQAQVVAAVTTALQAQLAPMEAKVEAALEAAAQTSAQLPTGGPPTGEDGVPLVQNGQDVLVPQKELAAYYVQMFFAALLAAAPSPAAGS